MPTAYLNPSLHLIPDAETYILFVGTGGSIQRVNAGVAALLKQIAQTREAQAGTITDHLFNTGVILPHETLPTSPPQPEGRFYPTSVTLFLTNDCNLRCTYCYASGGSHRECMPWPIARAAIDLVIRNIVEQKGATVRIGFHGGGEQTHGAAWPLMRQCVEHARSKTEKAGKNLRISLATNGVLTADQQDWLARNVDSFTISLDGPQDLHDLQRPTADGRGSFSAVVGTIRYLEARGKAYALRATLTRRSLGRLKEIVTFFRSVSSCKTFHLEPVDLCGRCRTTNVEAPEPDLLLKELIAVHSYAKEKLKADIHFSGARIGVVTNTFCGAAGRNFAVTPAGEVTSCFEVTRSDDQRADLFFYGRYDTQTESFLINTERLKRLQSRTTPNLSGCKDCFAQYGCAGDCLAKTWNASGDIFDPGKNDRCTLNRGLLLMHLKDILANHKTSIKHTYVPIN